MQNLNISKRKIIIYTPKLNFKVGGIVVLHNLARVLLEKGVDAYLFVNNEEPYDNIFCNKFAKLEDIDDSAVVVYPEIVEGNPLNAKNVVRWILCDLGVHCRSDIYKTWNLDDMVFHFSTYNSKYDSKNFEILYTVWINPIIKNKNTNKRNGSCYLFKKAQFFHNKLKLIHPKDSTLIDNCSFEEIVDIFNEKEYFYSYDPYSFYDSVAALCGCIPIIYPIDGVKKIDWLKTRAMFQAYADSRDNISGIAYGVGDTQYAKETLKNVTKERMELVGFGERTIENFIQKTSGYFFAKRNPGLFKTVRGLARVLGWNVSGNIDLRNKKKNDIVIYTAIFGGKDGLIEPDFKIEGCDMVCFTDDPMIKSDVFDVRLVKPVHEDPTRNARMYKVLSHKFLPEYEYSVWIDGNIRLKKDDLKKIVSKHLSEQKMALYDHPDRSCIYQEADACIKLKKEKPDLIRRQIDHYRKAGYPKNNGLVMTSVVFRKNIDEDVVRVNEEWWEQICGLEERIRVQEDRGQRIWKRSL